MYLFYVTKIVLATSSAIVLHVSVLCDKNCPHYSQCYSITCICSMYCPATRSAMYYMYLFYVTKIVLATRSAIYSITCICSM